MIRNPDGSINMRAFQWQKCPDHISLREGTLSGVYTSWPREWRHATITGYLFAHPAVCFNLDDGNVLYVRLDTLRDCSLMPDSLVGQRVSYRMRWTPPDWDWTPDAIYDRFIVGERVIKR